MFYIKRCCTCKEIKAYRCFSKNKYNEDGFQSRCKLCVNAHAVLVRDNTKEYKIKYKQSNNDTIVKGNARYYSENKPKIAKRAKQYRAENDVYLKQKSKEYYANNTDRIKARVKIYANANKDKLRCYARNYNKIRRQTDLSYSMYSRMRKNIRRACMLWNFKNKHSVESILGCSCEFFRAYIESQFVGNMSWDNIRQIHLDHIVPLSSAKSASEIIRLNHWSNFQPLWENDNLAKSDTIPSQDIIDEVNMIYECCKLN